MPVRGLLEDMGLPTLMQWVCQNGSQARLSIHEGPAEAMLYFTEGSLVHAVLNLGESRAALMGEEVIYQILEWKEGSFVVEVDIASPEKSIDTPWSALLVEGLQRLDHEEKITPQPTAQIDTRRDSMASRSTTEILNDFLEVPGISSAVVVGRDGFVIEAVGGSRSINLDALGASLAYAIRGIERMGEDLKIRGFQDIFVEYGDAMILARPVGDAVIALVAPDASQLGIVRYQIRPLVAELATFF
jgi:predicted regulator of Ras-like GTPase activity (Roadblock/LC7/MglB family)